MHYIAKKKKKTLGDHCEHQQVNTCEQQQQKNNLS